MSKWLEYLETLGLLEDSIEGPPSTARESSTCITHNREPPTAQDAATTLQQAIHQAHDWQDLEKIMDQVSALVKTGQLSQEQIPSLTLMVKQKSHTLPEKAGKM